MSDIFGKAESEVEAEARKMANVGLGISVVETEVKAEAAQLVPVAQSFVAAHELWFQGAAFILGVIVGLIL